jgi:hypothetical protein
MGLVDLGRRRLGWQEDAALVASVRLERNGDEIQIRSINHDAVAHARALLEAVAGVVEASRLTGSDAVLADCGFSHEGRRWVRDVVAAPAPASSVSAVTLGELEAAIRSAWGSDTTDEPELWSGENPALGQCAVTALVVREYLGGEIVVAGVVRDGRRVGRLPGTGFRRASRWTSPGSSSARARRSRSRACPTSCSRSAIPSATRCSASGARRSSGRANGARPPA